MRYAEGELAENKLALQHWKAALQSANEKVKQKLAEAEGIYNCQQ